MIPRFSFTGILMYRFVISNDAMAKRESIGVSSIFLIRFLVFSRLYVLYGGHLANVLGK